MPDSTPSARRTRNRNSRIGLPLAIAVALGAHSFVFEVLLGLGAMQFAIPQVDLTQLSAREAARRAEEGAEPIDLQTLADRRSADEIVEELSKPDQPTPEEEKAEEQKKKEEEDKKADGQVVDIARPAMEKRPDKARFVSEFDSSVAHETRGKPGKDKDGATLAINGGQRDRLGADQRALPSGSPASRPGLPGPREKASASARTKPTVEEQKRQRLLRGENGASVEIGSDGNDARPGTPSPEQEESHAQRGAPGHRQSAGEDGVPLPPGMPHPNLHPSEEMLRRAIVKGTGSPDYIGDVDDGDATALNAKKFKYASFFNRIKRDVAREWNPSLVYVRHDPSGNIYGVKDRITVVRVHLKRDGSLSNLTLAQSSGAGFLDDEAMDAFRRAAPFVNPPPQLVEDDGQIHFNFGFIFELSGKTSTKVFRYE